MTQPDSNSLCSAFVEYIDGARMYFENESDKEHPVLHEIKLHFTAFIRHLIRNIPGIMRNSVINMSKIEVYFLRLLSPFLFQIIRIIHMIIWI